VKVVLAVAVVVTIVVTAHPAMKAAVTNAIAVVPVAAVVAVDTAAKKECKLVDN
jgi:hypothetical protein